MAVCPNGHDSASDDFCDTCGMRIGGSPPPGGSPPARRRCWWRGHRHVVRVRRPVVSLA